MRDTATRRPGGRTARVREDVLRAAEDLVIASGVAGLEITGLARRARVGRATVHRRWGDAHGVLEDMVERMVQTSTPRTDHGSLAADLHANATLVAAVLNHPRQGRLLYALIAAAPLDPAIGRAVTDFYAARMAVWAPCVDDAIGRGEAPEGTDPVLVLRAVAAPLYHQWLTSSDWIGADDVRRAVRVALLSARRGELRRHPARERAR